MIQTWIFQNWIEAMSLSLFEQAVNIYFFKKRFFIGLSFISNLSGGDRVGTHSDFALFSIFENLHISVDQVFF